MRLPYSLRVSALVLLLAPAAVLCAQTPRPPGNASDVPAFTLGVHASLGIVFPNAPPASQDESTIYGGVGAYGELSRMRFRPGLELRQQAFSSIGTVAGPRIAHTFGPSIAYATLLLGPGYKNVPGTGPDYSTRRVGGFTAEGAFGLDILPPNHPYYGVRVELITGRFSGTPGAHPVGLVVGYILRVP